MIRFERSLLFACLVAAGGIVLPADPAAAQDGALAGVWTLNPSISELPREIGFDVNWLPSSSGGAQTTRSGGGGRGRRGSASGGGNRGAANPAFVPREGYEDAQRVRVVTADARRPAARLTIVDTPGAVTITNELGQSQVLHPTGKQESIELERVPIPVTARRERDQLIAVYHVEQDRDVRYTYGRSATPAQLVVEIQFLDHGAGDKARRVYEPGAAIETPAPPAAGAAPPSPGPQAAETFDTRPGAELRGLQSLGILVEDLSAQAVGCGLNHDAIEADVSKRLADGGFRVRRNSDDDTYLYVNVMTATLPNATCVSRYDLFLYTHATATLSYRDRPVLVQVSLMHRGGISSSTPAAHAAAVARGLENYVDLFVSQIHAANK
jgi:hypothetical protein